ncbi:MAG: sugar ABC transporter permease [Ignavibacteriales bacterium]|nr:sugar ABC transporter permease [Ignavibacteriales bacterium]
MKKATPYLLLVPALLFTVFVLAYPLVQNLINSFSDVSMITGSSGWTGLSNYRHVFEDTLFWRSFANTSVYAVVGTALALVMGLGFALLLNLKLGKIDTIMGCLYTVPWVISPVVAGFAWKWLLNDNFGVVNYWLAHLGVAKVGTTWLGDPHTALVCVMLARIWQFYPFAMVMFLAGLQSIPQEEYEAAAVDGATMIKRFFYITLPNLKTVTSVLLVLGVIWSFNDFNMVFVMTRGGPMNSSMVLPVLVREFSFVQFDLGKGSALSVMIFALLTTLSFLYLKVISRGESI